MEVPSTSVRLVQTPGWWSRSSYWIRKSGEKFFKKKKKIPGATSNILWKIEALGYFRTLRGAVVFISRDPGEPDSPLRLVSHLQVSRWVRSLCQHKRSKNKEKDTRKCKSMTW